MAGTLTGQDALDYASKATGLDVNGNPIEPEDESMAIPSRFRDFQDQHFTVEGFNSLSPFEQDQINQTLSGFINYVEADPWDLDLDTWRQSTINPDGILYTPQSKDQWKSYLEKNSPERAAFLDGDTYGVEDEMRYMFSLFDDDNLEIPVVEEEEEVATEEDPAAEQVEMEEGEGDAKETTEEEIEEEEEDIQTILMNGSTQVTKENAKVSLGRTSAKDGGTQGYKKSNLANVTTSKNSNLNIK